ncbi:MAG: replication associated protein [Circoviridae sp.]|nr:MAG: replication associated protein [Circoviridae sp.]
MPKRKNMEESPKNLVVGYDFTISCEKMPDLNELVLALNQWFKKWVLQKEKGHESGYLHWQGRGSLIKAKRLSELIAQSKDYFEGVRWSITTTGVHEGQSFNYVMKADSRVEGPWTDKDYEEPPPMTRQLKEFKERGIEFEWHKQVLKICELEENRKITVIMDEVGNSCKSLFGEYLEYEGKAWEVPPFRQMEDISQCVMSVKPKKCYLIDMPRGMKKDKLGEFYSGIECLKNGVCWEKRYQFKKRRMDRPQVIVFSNMTPSLDLLSSDRWDIFKMQEDKSLKKMVF